MSEKKSWTLILTIVAAITSSIVTGIIDFIKNKPFFSTLGNCLLWCWNLLISILNFDIKVWWILVFLITLILILFLIAFFENKKDENTRPDFCNYQEDIIKDWKFTWKWSYFDSCWNVVHLKVHCPKCDTPIIANGVFHKCVRCDYMPRTYPLEPDKVKLLIYDNIRRKYKT